MFRLPVLYQSWTEKQEPNELEMHKRASQRHQIAPRAEDQPKHRIFRSLERMTPTLPLATLVKNKDAELKDTPLPFSHSRQSTCFEVSPPEIDSTLLFRLECPKHLRLQEAPQTFCSIAAHEHVEASKDVF